ncbi:AraC family transcriptional regulator [Ruminiclostridium cellulolyticum]|uniref:Transcriptional regulator, AraC family n=1 Tax=Ruminiclostridium cellulolyticum (strain ATCC 35319 / DSM 5812 / JCM 6584 / H10) TaxID=394503 RepID=B8I9A3_RUMCH|nr:AraC family transcriptional regulator [Ruminiclostridium cellulolyticum]ACL75363.1 transcriptional regulator, AraC family [Ruminiclostridium cellulolyticum H10]
MSIYNINNRYARPEAFYALNLTEFHMPPHTHNRCEIMYVVSGNCVVSAKKEMITLKKNQFIFLDQNVSHCLYIKSGTPCTILNLEFLCSPNKGGIDLNEMLNNSETYRGFIDRKEDFLVLNDNGKVGYALKDLISELEKKKSSDQFLLRILFFRMLVEFTRNIGQDSHYLGSLHLRKAQKYINEHLYEDLNVEMIAEYTGINHSYLQTLFSKQFNCGIIAYVNKLRMEHAAFLLNNSNMSITDMAFHLGYNSRQHFGYIFEKHYNMSPQQYRKLKGQNIKADTGGGQWYADENGHFKNQVLLKRISN